MEVWGVGVLIPYAGIGCESLAQALPVAALELLIQAGAGDLLAWLRRA